MASETGILNYFMMVLEYDSSCVKFARFEPLIRISSRLSPLGVTYRGIRDLENLRWVSDAGD